MSLKWAYGITTVETRTDNLLPSTIKSLAKAGFNKPRLFMDSPSHTFYEHLQVTWRTPTVGPLSNWMLGLAELYLREPNAHGYIMFQDDAIFCKNLRKYLEESFEACSNALLHRNRHFGNPTYYNLYTCPENEELRF